jgi:protein TonB
MSAAVVASLLVHAAILSSYPHRPKPKAIPKPQAPVIAMVMANLKDLEPEPIVDDGDNKPVLDTATYAPMLMDEPRIAAPTDFVQQLDLNSLVLRPDMSQVKVFTIPENISHGVRPGRNAGLIFNPSDLDRQPEPTLQPSPIFPPNLKREGFHAIVKVEFIVDPDGHVLNPVIIESNHSGFDQAALSGVARWKFRAGIKAGRRVNTRMQVPIVFKLNDGGNG